ncbi:HAD-like domain-containing protein [Pseudomassariella vexata]|uniref:HAD-like domain-containing protein n=1 Tax=Pseudomassariella vexata TaxID=1141098 RepID=A0A1Y2E4C2_9PEZI|nr:HAD-like domain-containing protein [Pseudomassariella vexata]ORY66287.1 HAD-like domain-containing protein [Pseudomassariella vexata]
MSLFMDFDGTITVEDTINEVASYALQVQAEQGDDLREEWGTVVREYMKDYGKHVAEYCPEEKARKSPTHEVGFLRELKTLELRSLERIYKCQVFKGITRDMFRKAGQDAVRRGVVQIRPGFKEFVETKMSEGWKVWIVSVNWSSAYIEGVCDVPGITVIANEVQDDGSIVGPDMLNQKGIGSRNLTNSRDKLDVMQAIIQDESKPTVYFGDSVTDLECLLAASTGIVISDDEDSKLLRTLGRIGKRVPRATRQEPYPALFWASDYQEVMNM